VAAVSETAPRRTGAESPWPAAGSYFVVKTHGFVPWIIRAGTRSWADHAGIVTDPDGGIIEAEPGRSRRGHLSEYAGCRIAINTGENTTATQRAVVAETALSMIGRPYDDLAICDDGLEALGWHWRWLARHIDGDAELICSSLVAIAGNAAGLDWRCGRGTYDEVTPGDLAKRPGMTPWRCPA
jgi:hypothetical protein